MENKYFKSETVEIQRSNTTIAAHSNKVIWRDVVGYETKYEVSNTGLVRSKDRMDSAGRNRIKGQVIKQASDKLGYKRLNLCESGKPKQWLVHRLVAEAFIDNSENLPCVNHKDENPSNNNAENLEWCTHRYNMNYGTKNERHSKSMKGKMLNRPDKSRVVIQYDKNGNFIKRFESTCEAKRVTGLSQSNISACCRGVQNHKTVGGFIFKYE